MRQEIRATPDTEKGVTISRGKNNFGSEKILINSLAGWRDRLSQAPPIVGHLWIAPRSKAVLIIETLG